MKFSIAKFAKSKYFVPGIVIGLVVFGWLVLLIAKLGPFGEEKEEFVSQPTTWSQKEDYVIKETPEGKFVINEKAGLSFKVPKGWFTEMHDTMVGLLSKEVNPIDSYGNISPKELMEKEVCLITAESAEFQKNSDSYVTIKALNELISSHEKYSDIPSNYEVITIDGYKALKRGQGGEYYISVEVPVENKLYRFETHIYSKNTEQCSHEFDKFLETVSIK